MRHSRERFTQDGGPRRRHDRERDIDMRTQRQQAGTASSSSIAPLLSGWLHRTCSCGSHTMTGEECADCRKKKQPLRLSSKEPLAPSARTTMESRFSYDFSRVRVHVDEKGVEPAMAANAVRRDVAFGRGPYWLGTSGIQNSFSPLVHNNAAIDDESIGDESGSGGSGQEFGGPALPSPSGEIPPIAQEPMPGVEPLDEGGAKKAKCPDKTVVEKTVDMTPAGIKKGYRTGYGACAVIRAEPVSTNWDGTKISEANKQTKNTCPKEFGISPCTGADTFTVGTESNSSVLGKLPATQNRFYDFHISRWNKGSLLHDRNPKNIDTCEAECEQSYSCGGVIIGKHTVTRTFSKGTSGSRDVTLVTVTKS
jgi:Domain of unknown function (DUF4157)